MEVPRWTSDRHNPDYEQVDDTHGPIRRALDGTMAPSTAANGERAIGLSMTAEAEDQSLRHPIRVVVAEDSYVIREFLTSALSAAPEVELVAVCSDREELERRSSTRIRTWCHRHPDAALGSRGGHPDRGALRETHPEVGVVVLSHYAEPAYALALLEPGSGGRAYLLKERIRNRDELIGAIEAVARGGSVIDPQIVDVLIAGAAAAPRLAWPS